jgi:hypothetical protein
MEKLNNIFFALMTHGPDGMYFPTFLQADSYCIKPQIAASLVWIPDLSVYFVQLI